MGDIGKLDIPADDNSQDEDTAPRETKGWHPDDAVAEIWSGADADLANMISMSLRENQIPCRSSGDEAEPDTATPSPQRLYVLPEDEAHAKEIVREIVDAVPPQ